MRVMIELRSLALGLADRFSIPPIAGVVFPPLHSGGQPGDAEFMAMALDSGAGGLSYLMLPADRTAAYQALDPKTFVGSRPEQYAEAFGCDDPLANMLGLAAINAICQEVMRTSGRVPDAAPDSIGLMDIADGDRVGMVGLFPPLLKHMLGRNAELVIVEKNPKLVDRYPNLKVTLDARVLRNCNKVLCTSATLLNDTLDDVLLQCRGAEHITVLGPTAGFFPDPLFERGVHVLGGRLVNDGKQLLRLIAEGRRWGDVTRKLVFQNRDYPRWQL
jgi:uncharacterized protein (DUF4213/DUF364 family)